jgi:hypothetical protein
MGREDDTVEDAQWVDQAGSGVDHDAGACGGADCTREIVKSNGWRVTSGENINTIYKYIR